MRIASDPRTTARLAGGIALLLLSSPLTFAQEPTAPAAEEPAAAQQSDPAAEDLEPAVDTSAPEAEDAAPQTSAAEAPAEARRDEQPRPRQVSAPNRIELDPTQITGNRELPRVLYIVPWKRSDLGDLVGKPANSLLDEVLMPVDRDVFRRENRYYRALSPDEAGQAPEARVPPAKAEK